MIVKCAKKSDLPNSAVSPSAKTGANAISGPQGSKPVESIAMTWPVIGLAAVQVGKVVPPAPPEPCGVGVGYGIKAEVWSERLRQQCPVSTAVHHPNNCLSVLAAP